MMTANATTGNTSEFVVESNWGLGESLLLGIVNSNRYIVDRKGKEITDKTINKKLKRVVLRGNKTKVADMPVELQEVSSLTELSCVLAQPELPISGIRSTTGFEGEMGL
jgi:phosphoenolpyruvate synthase/pyruvate phosphate dikinase